MGKIEKSTHYVPSLTEINYAKHHGKTDKEILKLCRDCAAIVNDALKLVQSSS